MFLYLHYINIHTNKKKIHGISERESHATSSYCVFKRYTKKKKKY